MSFVNVYKWFDTPCLIHQPLRPQVTPYCVTFRKASCSPL